MSERRTNEQSNGPNGSNSSNGCRIRLGLSPFVVLDAVRCVAERFYYLQSPLLPVYFIVGPVTVRPFGPFALVAAADLQRAGNWAARS